MQFFSLFNKLHKIYVTVRNFRGFEGFLNFFYDQYRDFFHPQKIFIVMIWFLIVV